MVSEDEIKSALMEMCRQGFFVEPAAAVAVAGGKQYIRDHASESEEIVSTLTGSGLKAVEQIARIVGLKWMCVSFVSYPIRIAR